MGGDLAAKLGRGRSVEPEQLRSEFGARVASDKKLQAEYRAEKVRCEQACTHLEYNSCVATPVGNNVEHPRDPLTSEIKSPRKSNAPSKRRIPMWGFNRVGNVRNWMANLSTLRRVEERRQYPICLIEAGA